MEFRPHLKRRDIAFAVLGIAATGTLMAGSVIADGGTVGGLAQIPDTKTTPVEPPVSAPKAVYEMKIGSDPLATSLVYSQLTIHEGDNVWDITNRQVRLAQSRLGINLSSELRLEAVNAIKNLAVRQNAIELSITPLIPGDIIDYPVSKAVDLVVQALATDPSEVAETVFLRALRQGLDVIANPPSDFSSPRDFITTPFYPETNTIQAIWMDKVNQLLTDMLTLSQAPVSDLIPAVEQCFVLDRDNKGTPRFRRPGQITDCTSNPQTPDCPDLSTGACWSRVNITGMVPPKSALKPEYLQWLNRRPQRKFQNGRPY